MNPFAREITVDEVELRLVRMPLVFPFETSFGRFTEETHLIVVLKGEGATGYGEAPLHGRPLYSHEDVSTAWHILGDLLLPQVAGSSYRNASALLDRFHWVRGHQTALASLELAFHDLHAKVKGVSLWEHYGGVQRAIPVGVSLGIERTVDALVARVQEYVDEGYRRIKVKIRPGWDFAPVNAIRGRFPDIPFTVDANAAYTLKDLHLFRELDRFRLGYIEQPLAWDDLLDHSRLQAELTTPLCLDESIDSARAARAALEMKACRVINIKPTRVGGFGATREIHDLCRRAGVPVWCGGRLETGIGRLHNVAIATLPGFSLPGDISGSARYYAEDLIDPPVIVDGGCVTPPAGPGIGHAVRADLLERVTVEIRRFAGGGELER